MPNWIMRVSRGYNFLDNQDEDITLQFWADDKEDAEEYINTHWVELVGKDSNWFLVSLEEQRTRGGYRPGAGRPTLPPEKKAKPKTVAKRIPMELAENLEKIEALLVLIEDWKRRSESSSSTSPRWAKLREFLADVEKIELKL
jgi:hypothetical protein